MESSRAQTPPTSSSAPKPTPLKESSKNASGKASNGHTKSLLHQELSGRLWKSCPGVWAFLDTQSGPSGPDAALTACSRSPPLYENGQWQTFPQPASEARVLAWLTTVVDRVTTTPAPQSLYKVPATPLQGPDRSRIKMDVGFFRTPRAPKSAIAWRDVLVVGEVKKDAHSTIDNRVASYIRQVFSSETPRRFVVAFTLVGPMLDLRIATRGGVVVSDACSIHDQPQRLLRLCLLSLYADPATLGVDPAYLDSGTELRLDTCGKSVHVTSHIWTSSSVCGRATRIMRGRVDGHDGRDGYDVIIKDSWPHTGTSNEGELLATLQDSPHVCQCLYSESLDETYSILGRFLETELAEPSEPTKKRKRTTKDESTKPTKKQENKRKQKKEPIPPSIKSTPQEASQKDNRVHRRLVLADVGKPLYKAASLTEALNALADSLRGHRELMANGILHRDISLNNILIRDNGTGMLIDLDLAIRTDRKVGSGALGRTGTTLYMAVQCLLNGTSHHAIDDIESFFWVLFWFATHWEGPERGLVEGGSHRDVHGAVHLDTWPTLPYDMLGSSKNVLLFRPTSLNLTLDVWLTDACVCLRSPLQKLAELVKAHSQYNDTFLRSFDLDSYYEQVLAILDDARKESEKEEEEEEEEEDDDDDNDNDNDDNDWDRDGDDVDEEKNDDNDKKNDKEKEDNDGEEEDED